ncbi:TPR-like protein [Calocera viscosa TUFC12733]|uniref:TPR-like protein n=1 Tax=Calocera viscosa (strain TUFC12733) TaxID=1330018 RepID=A0A167HPF2_CALVF|nr:TPR-like protein [Calocera viscosa TUFC12733]
MPRGRGARDLSDSPVIASVPIAPGSSQPKSSSAETPGARLKARLQQWLSDTAVPLDPVKQKMRDTVLSVVGVQEELRTGRKDANELIGHASWVTDQILAKIQAESVPDDATKDVTDALFKTVSDIKLFLKSPPSTVAEHLGTQRAERLATFRQELDALRIQFLEVRVVYLSQQDAGIYAGQIPSNLPLVEIPPAPTVFYGRDELVESLMQLLLREATCRIPLLGAGGMGKTSVAAAVINHTQIKDKFGENIIFLSCENLVSAEGIISALAAYFKLRHGSRTLADVLARLSALDCVLLVLDNLETPLETSDSHRVEQFLGKVAEVSCLSLMITMRGTTPPDCVVWEKAYSHPLDRLPLDAGLQIWHSIAGSEDAKLAELLTQLDGLPLAIRLMASQAQLSRMTPTQLLGAYENEATRLLKSRGGGRLKSLDVSIQLSLECKSMTEEPNAPRLLSVLSLLPDGVPLDALPAMLPSAMWTIIASASVLLQVALAFQENGRLRVLSPIRGFIQAKYPPQGSFLEETENYFMTLIRDYRTGAQSRKRRVEMISADVGNIRSLLIDFWKTADQSKNVKERLDATLQISRISYFSSYGDCVPMLATAEVALQAMGHRLGAARCIQNLGNLLYTQDRYAEAADKLREAKAAFEAIGDPSGTAQCTLSLGDVLYMEHQYAEVADKLREAKAGFEAIGDVRGTAHCTQRLGDLLIRQSRYDEAADKLREAKAAFESIGSIRGTAHCTQRLGDVLRSQSRYEEAADKVREAKAAFEAIGNLHGTAHCTVSLGDILYLQDRYAEAVDQMREANAVFEAIGNRIGQAWCYKTIGAALHRQGHYDEAGVMLNLALEIFESIRYHRGAAECNRCLGEVLRSEGHYEAAIERLTSAKSVCVAMGERHGVAECVRGLGDVLCAEKHYEAAAKRLREAQEVFIALGSPADAAQCCRSLAEVFSAQDRHVEVEAMLLEAREIFEEIKLPKRVGECTEALARLRLKAGQINPGEASDV